jgi:hypothetical protein
VNPDSSCHSRSSTSARFLIRRWVKMIGIERNFAVES